MIKKTIVLILFFINFKSAIFAQFEYKKLLFIPWGNKTDQIKLREVNSGRIGPTSFSVNGENIFVLDFNAKQLKQFLKGQHKSNILIENPLHDVFYINEYGSPVFNTFQNFLINKDISVKIENNYTLSIKGSGFDLLFEDSLPIGFGQYLGRVANNHHYIYVENIIQHVPLLIERKIIIIDQFGKVKIIFHYPNNNFTYIPQEFFVNDGDLFFLISRSEGVTVSGWIYNDQIMDSLITYRLPEEMLRGNHYNFEIQNFEEPDRTIETDSDNESFIYPTVFPGEALETADSYVSFNWTAENSNMTNAVQTDPQGVMIQTPEWIQLGDNYHVPYKWGGFNTLDEFSSGLSENKFAGDKITDCYQNYCVSNYCVGVDCSGFISRCWNLSTHYSTAMMDDDITILYDSWEDLNPGDAIHKVGHVRMVVFKNTDGSILTVEASGYDWRVSYRTYNLSQLTAYSPRYYQGMEGTATSIPIPILSSVIKEDQIILNWGLSTFDEVSGFNIYRFSDNDNWILLNFLDTLVTSLSFIDQTSPVYFNLTSVSENEGAVEGFNSDSYGAFGDLQSKDILIVDGFDRTSGSYPFPYHSFGMRMGQALYPWGYSFDTVDNDELLSGNILLENYKTVFWLLGDESTADETFSLFEQNLVKDYLIQGGKIFISGSEIAWDLDQMGNASDKNFINDYLKTKYDLDDSNDYEVIGSVESSFSGLTLNYDNGNYGVYEENYPDAFLCYGGSLPALNYSNGLIAATHYTGTISTSQNISQVFVLGFPFETIYDESQRVGLVGRILYYFGYDVQLEKMIDQISSEDFRLYTNYPNPFNPLTKIKYSVPQYRRVKIDVFDVLGKKIKTLVDDNHSPGNHFVEWDATNDQGIVVSSGLYFYKIQSGEYISTNKMCFLK